MYQPLEQFYSDAITSYGPDDPRSLRWSTFASQVTRFEVLSQVGKLQGSSVLDMGCGFGDFYGFLEQKDMAPVIYKGVDIHPQMIDTAKHKYPDLSFEVADFKEYKGSMVDYVVSSGALSFKIPDHKEIYFGFIRKMFELSKKAAAFNMLNNKYHIDNDTFAAYNPAEVYAFCSTLTDKLTLRQDYVPEDFTLYLYR